MQLAPKQRAWLEIDLSKIAHNIQEMQRVLPATTKIMGIVKDNAYGHGDVEVTREMERLGIDFFGIATMEEAIALRTAGITSELLILAYTPMEYVGYLQEYNLIQTIVSLDHAIALNDYALAHQVKLRCHLKVDTGMARVGIRYVEGQKQTDEILAVYQLAGLHVEGVFSHFSVSDDLHPEHLAYTQKQIELYDEVLTLLAQAGLPKPITHLQNTYGILNYPHLPYDYVRPGLLHLGLTSHKDIAVNHPLDLQPIMECKAQITLVKTIHSGASVSYGRNFVAHHDMQVATVSIGYGDGYPRILSNTNTCVLVHGVLCPVIGNVCMDQIVVDVSKVECAVEDVVTLFGFDEGVELPLDQISHKAQTINNDTLCMLNARLPRTYKR